MANPMQARPCRNASARNASARSASARGASARGASTRSEPPPDVPIESRGRSLAVGEGAEILAERAVHLAREVALQAADRLAFRPTLLHAALEVRPRAGTVP